MPALLLCLSGCASIPEHVSELPADVSLDLDRTPFFPQERYQCGPAALATVLASSGVAVDLGALVDRVYLPGRKGSLQVEMLAASRAAGRVPYVIDGTLLALQDELDAGRPVVVLQNLGVTAIPKWHYAVVVGIGDADARAGIGLDEDFVAVMDHFVGAGRGHADAKFERFYFFGYTDSHWLSPDQKSCCHVTLAEAAQACEIPDLRANV